MEIRSFAFDDADYQAYAEILVAARPDHATTASEFQQRDGRRADYLKFARFVAVESGVVVGVGQYDQWAFLYHPDRYRVDVFITPEWQGHGIGTALYEKIVSELEPKNPLALTTNIFENELCSLRFVEKRGFVEVMRTQMSWLFLADFPSDAFQGDRLRMAQEGIVLKSLTELESDPDYKRKVWEVEMITMQDVPSNEPMTPFSFEEYNQFVFENMNCLPGGFIVAIDEKTGEYVGTSNFWRRQADNDLEQGLTAVRREYRRKGIALAMKLAAIEWAKGQGFRAIRTENEVNNTGMLAINRQLGFVVQPAQLILTRTLREEA